MKKILILTLLFASCTRTIYVPTTEYVKGKDSIRIEYKDSLIYLPAPAQFNEVITNQRSHLETDYSLSNAWIDTTGLLHHNIANVLKIPVKMRTQTVYESHIDTVRLTKTITVTNTVIKQHIPFWAWIGWIILGGGLFWKIRKFFGVPI